MAWAPASLFRKWTVALRTECVLCICFLSLHTLEGGGGRGGFFALLKEQASKYLLGDSQRKLHKMFAKPVNTLQDSHQFGHK